MRKRLANANPIERELKVNAEIVQSRVITLQTLMPLEES